MSYEGLYGLETYKAGSVPKDWNCFRDPDFMNGRCFVILYICAPSMYGYASEWKRALPPAGPTAIAPQRLTCSSFPGCTFTGLALLQSSCPSNQCLAFLARTMIHFLLVPFLLDRAHCANFSSRPSFRATIHEVFSKVCSICSPSTTPEYRW